MSRLWCKKINENYKKGYLCEQELINFKLVTIKLLLIL